MSKIVKKIVVVDNEDCENWEVTEIQPNNGKTIELDLWMKDKRVTAIHLDISIWRQTLRSNDETPSALVLRCSFSFTPELLS